ncbi:InlB B-repeat-containing protein [Lachnoclostridium sp. Marseille-P6806]|uniref:InlB B-repeat-containing protein n=1 Tax=Lachnoclostridium sp. Marseille-P6806 TaxID=2364793 RepID=UPI00103200E1|nr:InlB B-repeat-containing protein [Lachnoclostridium sp. Marseille-P6806]
MRRIAVEEPGERTLRSRRNSRKTAGFTLTELIVTALIIVILAAIGFVAVARYRRSLRMMEMNSIAKEIFMAAQNHLLAADSQGMLDKFYESTDADRHLEDLGTPIGNPGVRIIDGEGNEVADGTFYAAVYCPGEEAPAILSYMLPYGAVDPTVREDGSYIIEYERTTGTVVGVFYSGPSEEAGFRFRFTGYAADDLANARRDDRYKKHYATGEAGSGKYIIGYYNGNASIDSSDNRDITVPTEVTRLKAPTIRVVNDETLYVEVYDNNDAAMIAAAGAKLRLFVNDVALEVTEAGQPFVHGIAGKEQAYRIYLDDITHRCGTNFAALFAGRIAPGEDLVIRAQSYSNTVLSDLPESAAVTTNSLFGSLAGGSAAISNFRHLENLDREISGMDDRQIEAVLTRDLTWGDDTIFAGTESAETLFRRTAEGTYLYGCGGTRYAANRFRSIDNASLAVFDGDGHTIRGITPDGGGLFRDLHDMTVSELSLRGLIVTSDGSAGALAASASGAASAAGVYVYDAAVSGSTAGGLVGTVSGSGVRFSNVLVREETESGKKALFSAKVNGSACAGGLVGEISGSLRAAGAGAAVYVDGGNGEAGGFVGRIGGSAELVGCYAGGHTRDKKYQATADASDAGRWNVSSSGTAGGFAGSVEGAASFTASYSTCSVSGGTAGGFAGAGGGASYRYCYAGGLIDETRAGTRAGLFAGTLGSASVSDSYCLSGISDMTQELSGGTDIPGVKEAGPEETAVISPQQNAAHPYDPARGNAAYPLRTVAQLLKDAGVGGTELSEELDRHCGDWQFPALTEIAFSVRNEEKLSAEIVFPAGDSAADDSYTLSVTGRTSGKSRLFVIRKKTDVNGLERLFVTAENTAADEEHNLSYAEAEQYAFPYAAIRPYQTAGGAAAGEAGTAFSLYLDDVTAPADPSGRYAGGHFAQLFGPAGLLAGEEIEVRAARGEKTLPAMLRQNEEGKTVFTVSSLFGDGSNHAPDGLGTAYMDNARHLQNLDPAVSGIAVFASESSGALRVEKAQQRQDIDWADFTARLAAVNALEFAPFAAADPAISAGAVMLRAVSAGSGELTEEGAFYGIENTGLSEYDGQKHRFVNAVIRQGKSGETASGMFRRASGPSLSVRRLVIENADVDGADAGALAGAVEVGGCLTAENVMVTGSRITGSGNAGGLIGVSLGDSALTGTAFFDRSADSSVQTDSVPAVTGAQSAGGIAGSVAGGRFVLDRALAASASGQIASGSADAGGLIGSVTGAAELRAVSAGSAVHVAAAGSAGGLIGRLAASGKAEIADSYASGYTREGDYPKGSASVAGGGYTGGLIGLLSSPAAISGSFSTAAVRAADQGAGGFLGGMTGGSAELTGCYATGTVSAAGGDIGSFAGTLNGSVSFSDCSVMPLINDRTMALIGSNPGNRQVTERFAYGNAAVLTHKWDADHPDGNYPFAIGTVSPLPQDSGSVAFYGDWPQSAIKEINSYKVEFRDRRAGAEEKLFKGRNSDQSIQYVQQGRSVVAIPRCKENPVYDLLGWTWSFVYKGERYTGVFRYLDEGKDYTSDQGVYSFYKGDQEDEDKKLDPVPDWVSSPEQVYSDLTVYTIYSAKPNHYVTYKLRRTKADGTDEPDRVLLRARATDGGTVETPKTVSYGGFKFLGWFHADAVTPYADGLIPPEGGPVSYGDAGVIRKEGADGEDTVLYARYSAVTKSRVTVHFRYYNGEFTSEDLGSAVYRDYSYDAINTIPFRAEQALPSGMSYIKPELYYVRADGTLTKDMSAMNAADVTGTAVLEGVTAADPGKLRIEIEPLRQDYEFYVVYREQKKAHYHYYIRHVFRNTDGAIEAPLPAGAAGVDTDAAVLPYSVSEADTAVYTSGPYEGTAGQVEIKALTDTPGFTAESGDQQRVLSSENQIMTIYYSRNRYWLSYNLAGGAKKTTKESYVEPQSFAYGEPVVTAGAGQNITGEEIERAGYAAGDPRWSFYEDAVYEEIRDAYRTAVTEARNNPDIEYLAGDYNILDYTAGKRVFAQSGAVFTMPAEDLCAIHGWTMNAITVRIEIQKQRVSDRWDTASENRSYEFDTTLAQTITLSGAEISALQSQNRRVPELTAAGVNSEGKTVYRIGSVTLPSYLHFAVNTDNYQKRNQHRLQNGSVIVVYYDRDVMEFRFNYQNGHQPLSTPLAHTAADGSVSYPVYGTHAWWQKPDGSWVFGTGTLVQAGSDTGWRIIYYNEYRAAYSAWQNGDPSYRYSGGVIYHDLGGGVTEMFRSSWRQYYKRVVTEERYEYEEFFAGDAEQPVHGTHDWYWTGAGYVFAGRHSLNSIKGLYQAPFPADFVWPGNYRWTVYPGGVKGASGSSGLSVLTNFEFDQKYFDRNAPNRLNIYEENSALTSGRRLSFHTERIEAGVPADRRLNDPASYQTAYSYYTTGSTFTLSNKYPGYTLYAYTQGNAGISPNVTVSTGASGTESFYPSDISIWDTHLYYIRRSYAIRLNNVSYGGADYYEDIHLYGERVTRLPVPDELSIGRPGNIEAGYVFRGWYSSRDFSSEKNRVTDESGHVITAEGYYEIPASNQQLFAYWAPPDCTIVRWGMDPTGSVMAVTPANTDRSVTVKYTEYAPEDPPAAAGFRFEGWYRNYDPATGSYADPYPGGVVSEDLTLYAKWSSTVDVEYTICCYDVEDAEDPSAAPIAVFTRINWNGAWQTIGNGQVGTVTAPVGSAANDEYKKLVGYYPAVLEKEVLGTPGMTVAFYYTKASSWSYAVKHVMLSAGLNVDMGTEFIMGTEEQAIVIPKSLEGLKLDHMALVRADGSSEQVDGVSAELTGATDNGAVLWIYYAADFSIFSVGGQGSVYTGQPVAAEADDFLALNGTAFDAAGQYEIRTALAYIDGAGNVLTSPPVNAGNYTVKAVASLYDMAADSNAVIWENVYPSYINIYPREVYIRSADGYKGDTKEQIQTVIVSKTADGGPEPDIFAGTENVRCTFYIDSMDQVDKEMPNAFAYELTGGARPENYSISVKFGTLYPTPAP